MMVEMGEYVVLMGRLGIGKILLLEVICGLCFVVEGWVYLENIDCIILILVEWGIGYVL